MDILLRDPAEKNPPPLLQGDNVLYSQLAAGIRNFHDAFYKSSWRAFDWMWGRLDGCGELAAFQKIHGLQGAGSAYMAAESLASAPCFRSATRPAAASVPSLVPPR
jgi:Protein of unknown function (DUF3376)